MAVVAASPDVQLLGSLLDARPAFNQETAADHFVKSKELKRETGNCANPNLPLHRTMRLAG